MLRKYFASGVGSLVAQAINVLSLPLITRIYAPDDYASYSVISAAVVIMGNAACCRYELAIVIAKRSARAASLFWTCIAMVALSSVVAAAVVAIPAARTALFADSKETWAVAPMIAATGVSVVLSHWQFREGRFLQVSIGQVALVNATVITQYLYGTFVEASERGLILGQFIGVFVSVVVLAWGCRPQVSSRPLRIARALLRRNRRFLLYSTPYTIAGSLAGQGTLYILQSHCAAGDVGRFAFVYRVFFVPVGLAAAALRPVLFREAAQHGLARMEERTSRILIALAATAGPAVALFLAFPNELFIWVFGEEWAGSGDVGVVLIWFAVSFMLGNWMDRYYDILKLQRSLALQQVLAAGIALSAMYFAVSSTGGFWLGITIYSAVRTIEGMIFIAVIYRRAKFQMRALIRAAGVFGVALFGSWSVLLGLRATLAAPVAIGVFLVVGVLCGAVGWRTLARRSM